MATATQRQRLRDDIGANITAMPDAEADAIFDEAGESYSDLASQTAATRVIALRRILASAAKLTDYTQNESQEKLSQVFAHLKDLLAFWQEELVAAETATAGSAARFGRTRAQPARIKEYPGL